MFATFSHRSQSLAERQVRLLQILEQGEKDPGRQAILLRLNSIASRMQRNSENLLILAGQEPSRTWNQPVALVNVIRAAVSEVEESQRISLNAHPDIAIAGSAVNDIVHLLAELIENATSFSAADMRVDISGRLLTSGGALLEVTDQGIGMSQKELAYANWRLENPPAPEINVPRWIGLFVVARLAARHGVGVRLQPADAGGLTALVWLPDGVLTRPGTASAPRLGDIGTAGTRRGLHEADPEPGYVTTGRGSDSAQAATARPGTAAQVSRETSPGDGVIVPSADDLTEKRGSPIFNEVESRWFRDGRGTPASSGASAAAGSRWSSPADTAWPAAEAAVSPSSDGSTAAGLPKRPPHANFVPGAIPSTETVVPNRSAAAARERLAGLQRGIGAGRAAARQAVSPGEGEEQAVSPREGEEQAVSPGKGEEEESAEGVPD